MVMKYMDEKPLLITSTAREIAETLQIPYDTTAKIMQGLKQADILRSIQGVKGGYAISIGLDDINYLDFLSYLGERALGLECASGHCDNEEICNISTPMKRLNESLHQFFGKLTLRELLT